jgi:hypothetical protein
MVSIGTEYVGVAVSVGRLVGVAEGVTIIRDCGAVAVLCGVNITCRVAATEV